VSDEIFSFKLLVLHRGKFDV